MEGFAAHHTARPRIWHWVSPAFNAALLSMPFLFKVKLSVLVCHFGKAMAKLGAAGMTDTLPIRALTVSTFVLSGSSAQG